MKISRKIIRQVENKIRHSMVTGSFHSEERSATSSQPLRQGTDKTSSGEDQGK